MLQSTGYVVKCKIPCKAKHIAQMDAYALGMDFQMAISNSNELSTNVAVILNNFIKNEKIKIMVDKPLFLLYD